MFGGHVTGGCQGLFPPISEAREKRPGTKLSVGMSGNLNMSNDKINNISNSTNNFEAIDKQYVDTGFLKLSGGTITGRLYLPTNSYVSGNETLNLHQIKGFFIIEQDNPYVETRFNMANNKHDKIINLADPENNGDAVSKNYVNTVIQKYQLKSSHHDNQFAHLMQNTLVWSDLTSAGNSFNMVKIGDLSPHKGNFHSYNHKVTYTTMIKN